MSMIKEKVEMLGGIEEVASKDFWKQICVNLQFVQSDAVWILKQACKYLFSWYLPTQQAICRQQKRLANAC